MRRITYLLILLLLATVGIKAVEIERLSLTSKHLSTANGLSSNTVYDFQQDKNGFIWFGAAYGLCRYDGYSFSNLYSLSSDANKRSDATIGNLYRDDNNDLLWIHTSTFTFACYDIRRGRFIDYTGKGDEQRSFRRFIRQENTMWMYDTRNGIRHISYKDGDFVCTDYNTEDNELPTNHVARMVEDGSGNVWAMTDKGLIKIDSAGKISVFSNGKRQIDGTSYNGNVICLEEGNKVTVYSPHGEILKETTIPSSYGRTNNLRSHFVWQGKWMLFGRNTIAIDLSEFSISMPDNWQVPNGWLLDAIDGYFFESNSSGRLWIFPPEGEVRSMSLIPNMRYTAERNRRYNVERGDNGLFYIATYGNGLFIYDYDKDKFRHLSASDEQPVISSNYLLNLHIDRSGCLWVSQESSGVSCISVSESSATSFLLPQPDHKGDLANFIRMTAKEENGNILLSTSDNKMYRHDTQTGSIELIGEQDACVYAYHKDRRGNIWLATRGDGIYIGDKHYNRGGRQQYKVASDHYHDIAEDKKGRMWLSTYEEGLLMAQYDNDGNIRFQQFLARDNNERRLHQLELDSIGRLWIASHNGLYVLDTSIDNISNNSFKCFNSDNSALPFYEIRCLAFSSDGYLWTGGKGSGMVRCEFNDSLTNLTFKQITTKEGLASNTICSIIEDWDGCIWAATENGLSMIYDNDMKVKSFHFDGNIERNIFSDRCAVQLNDGRLLFGTRYGINTIIPSLAKEQGNQVAPTATITDIIVNGVSASDSSMLQLAPNYCDEIALDYDDNSIALYFSTLEYSNLQSALYQYYLEGADKDWRPMTSVNHVDYNNLPSGKYVFHLRSLCNNKWGDERTLSITILQPWYNSWWAWIVYIIIIALLGLYVYHNAKEKLRLHEQMKVEKQVTEFRMNFFTNITHEFRTPLAIIQGAVNKLQTDNTSKSALQTAQRGTKRLLKMVNQLLEFRKVTTNNMRLSLEHDDIVSFIKELYQDFWNMAQQKDIKITFTPFVKHFELPFDKQMVETIIYNLLSNALKYTPERGIICIRLRYAEKGIILSVENSGPGISKEQQASLFQPFMQGNASKGGMGIGLYTAQRMAALHHGTLEHNRKDDMTIFTLTLPTDENSYTENDFKKTLAIDPHQETDNNNESIILEPLPDSLNNITVAIIEDDYDMMEQISNEMAKYFRITRYYNGKNAIKGITEDATNAEESKQPKLIICDVMLPDMEGYDIVKQLKTGTDTADIPVIMLTALNDEKHQLHSYEAGADDYMVKPCNYRLLIGRAIQFIKMYDEKEKSIIPVDQTSQEPQLPAIITSASDKHFLEKINTIIAQHISDSDFNVDCMTDMMNMGRTKFFNKMKELTGMSPNKYLQNERMRIAAELLISGEHTVAEVSYKVGIQDASYFNKCFKARYGIVPSKYGKQ